MSVARSAEGGSSGVVRARLNCLRAYASHLEVPDTTSLEHACGSHEHQVSQCRQAASDGYTSTNPGRLAGLQAPSRGQQSTSKGDGKRANHRKPVLAHGDCSDGIMWLGMHYMACDGLWLACWLAV